MKKKATDSLFSPDTIFFVQWGGKHYPTPQKKGGNPDTGHTNGKDKGYGELKITDYYIPIKT